MKNIYSRSPKHGRIKKHNFQIGAASINKDGVKVNIFIDDRCFDLILSRENIENINKILKGEK